MNWLPNYGISAHEDQALVYDEAGKNIAVVYEGKNARLIAAAPELLEALQNTLEIIGWIPVDVFTIEGRNEMRKRIDTARAAIAKAEGN